MNKYVWIFIGKCLDMSEVYVGFIDFNVINVYKCYKVKGSCFNYNV